MSVFSKIKDYIEEIFLFVIEGFTLLWDYIFDSKEPKKNKTKSEEFVASVILEERQDVQFLYETFEILSESDISEAQTKSI